MRVDAETLEREARDRSAAGSRGHRADGSAAIMAAATCER